MLRLDGGRVLAGGAPFTVLRLRRPVTAREDPASPVGRRLVATGLAHPDVREVPPVDPAELTVVVPTDGRAVRPGPLAPLRVVVVDDGSSPPVPGGLRRSANGGPAAARNTGLATVTTPYVAFVDADVEVTAEDLLAVARHLADPAVVAVAPRVRGTATGRAWWQRHDTTHAALDLGPEPAEVRPGGPVAYLPAACLVVRTAALAALGGFDERLRVGEDVDLVWRLRAAGGRVRYDPSVVVHHETRATPGAWLRQSYGYGTSAAPLARRHGDAVAPAVLSPGLGLAAAAVLLRHRYAVPLALAAAARTTGRLRGSLPPVAAARVAGRALGWSVRQEASLLVRHWWPAAAVAAVGSRRARRAVATALVVDSVVALLDRREGDVVSVLAGRRAGDLAYGAGVWVGAWRDGSPACLRPRRAGRAR